MRAGRGLCRASAVRTLTGRRPRGSPTSSSWASSSTRASAARAATRGGGSSTPAAPRPGKAIARALADRVRAHPRIDDRRGRARASSCGRTAAAAPASSPTAARSRRARRCSRPAATRRSGSARRTRPARSARGSCSPTAPAPRSPTSSSCSSTRRRSSTTGSCSPRRCAARARCSLDDDGERFTDELAPRDVVARAIAERGHARASTCAGSSAARFPGLMATLERAGYDPAAEPIPVSPAAHYTIGGIVTDLDGRTTLPGLYAAGECACTGVHGANRLASNSLLECLVFGRRAGARRARASPRRGLRRRDRRRRAPEPAGDARAPPRALARRRPDPRAPTGLERLRAARRAAAAARRRERARPARRAAAATSAPTSRPRTPPSPATSSSRPGASRSSSHGADRRRRSSASSRRRSPRTSAPATARPTASCPPARAAARALLLEEPASSAALAGRARRLPRARPGVALRARCVADGDARRRPATVVAELEGRRARSSPASARRSTSSAASPASRRSTRRYVDAVEGTGATILDTRKTTPGLRALEKYAVRCGGGANHRARALRRVLVKENHLRHRRRDRARRRAALRATGLPIEVEAETLAEVAEALEAGAERILLDNMTPGRGRRARSSSSPAGRSSRPPAASRSTPSARTPRPASTSSPSAR